MQAVAIDRFGPPSVLKSRTMPVPKVGPSEVLIALHAAEVGIWDAKIRDGTWAEGDERFPLVLGTDGAGVVAARGARVRRLQVGDRVWAYVFGNPKGGFYAEYVAVKAEHVGKVPPRLDLLQAGAGVVSGLTALQGIDQLRLTDGATVLIFGGSGSVGSLAIQMARFKGARVLATASGPEATALVRELGAEAAIDTRQPEAVERLRQLSPDGLDAVFATAGGEGLDRLGELVRSGGRLSYPNGVEPKPQARREVRVLHYDAVANPRKFAELERAVEEGGIRVPIAQAYPLAEAAEAHARVERGRVLGRVALKIR
jgi:NADPH:quinone reductase-like Zn-dependent oxidoreductase